MTFDQIFAAYYTLYRGESDPPESTDEEYTVGLGLANEAVARWENFDATYWKELFTTVALNNTTITIVAGTTTYTAPTNMREAGGHIRLIRNGTIVKRIPIIDPQEAQFRGEQSKYAYFLGNPASGFTLHLNPSPDSSDDGCTVDFDYYKKATTFDSGSDTTEMANPYFIVHRMLAQRFRVSRNPYYSSALRDAEDALKIMQQDNNSGNWANPWQMADRSGTKWGQDIGGNRSFF